MLSVQLTPMEEQVVQVLAALSFEYNTHGDMDSDEEEFWLDEDIWKRGRHMVSDTWGGSARKTTNGNDYYPLINRFLGSLHTKGLVVPYEPRTLESYNWWRLSAQGRELAGLVSLALDGKEE